MNDRNKIVETTIDEAGYEIVATGANVGRFATYSEAIRFCINDEYAYISKMSLYVTGVRHTFDRDAYTLVQLEKCIDFWTDAFCDNCLDEPPLGIHS